jgi:hypothetical protein
MSGAVGMATAAFGLALVVLLILVSLNWFTPRRRARRGESDMEQRWREHAWAPVALAIADTDGCALEPFTPGASQELPV